MTVISINAAKDPLIQRVPEEPKKPLSLKVYETAIPILKVLSFAFELAADFAACFVLDAVLTVNPVMLTISAVVLAVSAILFFTLDRLERKMSRRLERLDNPDWVQYFSLAYRSRPLEELIEALPNKRCWKKLEWNGLDWKRKILPYAEKKGVDRKALKSEFSSVFDLFNPYFYPYYRKIELPLLQKEGFHAYLANTGDLSPKTIQESELREQLRKETQDLTQAQIEEQYPAKFIQKYL